MMNKVKLRNKVLSIFGKAVRLIESAMTYAIVIAFIVGIPLSIVLLIVKWVFF